MRSLYHHIVRSSGFFFDKKFKNYLTSIKTVKIYCQTDLAGVSTKIMERSVIPWNQDSFSAVLEKKIGGTYLLSFQWSLRKYFVSMTTITLSTDFSRGLNIKFFSLVVKRTSWKLEISRFGEQDIELKAWECFWPSTKRPFDKS